MDGTDGNQRSAGPFMRRRDACRRMTIVTIEESVVGTISPTSKSVEACRRSAYTAPHVAGSGGGSRGVCYNALVASCRTMLRRRRSICLEKHRETIRMRIPHPERHRTENIGWLRAAVLGANDGIVSTASLVVGVAASNAAASEILV